MGKILQANVVIKNIGQLVTNDDSQAQKITFHRASQEDWSPLGVIEHAAIWIKDGYVSWCGPQQQLPKEIPVHYEIDAQNRVLIPGLIDCHTHAVFAQGRVDEFAMRCRGASYEEIAEAGGGIKSSMRSVRQASQEHLVTMGHKHISRMLDRGVTTIEIKSGYGLSFDDEIKMLRAINDLRSLTQQRLMSTLLAAHSIPPEFSDNRQGYLDLIVQEIIPIVIKENLATFFDVFVEQNVFTRDEAIYLCTHAQQAGLKIKLHVDQLHAGKGAELAAELKAISADHLEYTETSGMKALANSHTVATMLPLCALYLGKGPFPDGKKLIENGAIVAVSTDFNPGSAHGDDLWLAATIAATKCGLSLVQAMQAITCNAAQALAMQEELGRIKKDFIADFVILDADDWRQPLYELSARNPYSVIIAGNEVKR